ncbi:hypothetical protein [Streptomyces paludis]|uniref:Uncharacterized protein n=1 Tax=Streptomyces paludis TaxID=2282738 RepID=A0A345I186_9ACTN|nr:hypothetical protein [Streptomyces paludis]AXG82710.1 hypothetical protein DVK44_18225 [Streptomyces paludis]
MVLLSATDCRYCEACWVNPVARARMRVAVDEGEGVRDLLCVRCAQGNFSRRVDLFPPFGIYRLTCRMVPLCNGKHGKPGPPKMPPDQGPALPPGPKPQSPPGTPPV